jgi:hypothetical protein
MCRNIQNTERIDKLENNQRPSYSSVASAATVTSQPSVFGATMVDTPQDMPITSVVSNLATKQVMKNQTTRGQSNLPNNWHSRNDNSQPKVQSALSARHLAVHRSGSSDNIWYQYQQWHVRLFWIPIPTPVCEEITTTKEEQSCRHWEKRGR